MKKFGCWIQISVKLYFQACKNLLESLCLPNKTKPSVQSTLSDQTRSLLHGLLETSGDLWRLLETFWDFWIIITEFLAPFLYFYGFINMDNFTTEQIHCPLIHCMFSLVIFLESIDPGNISRVQTPNLLAGVQQSMNVLVHHLSPLFICLLSSVFYPWLAAWIIAEWRKNSGKVPLHQLFTTKRSWVFYILYSR